MIARSFQAMGTTVEAWCRSVDDLAGLRSWFEEVESRFSRFRPDSELSRLNDNPASAVTVSEAMAELLREGDRARSITAGLVDIGVGAAVEGWGYSSTFEKVTDCDEAPGHFAVPGWRIDGPRFERAPGTRIDLGGIAKGWTCDRAVESGLASVVSAGGDMRSADPDTIASVLDDRGNVAARVRLGRGALATSSTSRRVWKVDGRAVSHIMDPSTMAPMSGPVLSATVVASTALDAEIGAKAVLLHGVDGLAWAEEQSWVRSAVVVWQDGSVFATVGTELAA